MSKIWFRFVVTCGVVLGTLDACQLGRAADPASASPAADAPPKDGVGDATHRPFAVRGAPYEKPSEAPLTVLKSGPDHVRVVYRLKHSPATNVNTALQQLFRIEGDFHKADATSAKAAAGSSVAMAPEPVTNSLIISGPPEAVDEVRTLLDKMDKPPAMVLMEMEMGEAPISEVKPAEAPPPQAKSGTAAEPVRLSQRPVKMETIARARVMTLDNQPAFVQMGSRVPRFEGTSANAPVGKMRVSSMDNVGLILGVTPRISPDGTVTFQIDAEQSQMGPENEGVPISVAGDKVIRASRIDTTTVQTTVRVPNAETVILASARQGKGDKELVIIITPHIVGLDDAKKTQ